MSYRNLISCHVSDAVRDAFCALAKARGVTVASLLRQMIVLETINPAQDRRDLQHQILFLAMAMERLLEVHGNGTLHAELVRDWRARIAEENRRHAG